MKIFSKCAIDENQINDRLEKDFAGLELYMRDEVLDPSACVKNINEYVPKNIEIVFHAPWIIQGQEYFIDYFNKGPFYDKPIRNLGKIAYKTKCKVYPHITAHVYLRERADKTVKHMNKILKDYDFKLSLETRIPIRFLGTEKADITEDEILSIAKKYDCSLTLDTAHLSSYYMYYSSNHVDDILQFVDNAQEQTKIIHVADSRDVKDVFEKYSEEYDEKYAIDFIVRHGKFYDNMPLGTGSAPLDEIFEKLRSWSNIGEIPIVTEIDEEDYNDAVNQLEAKEIIKKKIFGLSE